jgi:hypothetical protein
MPDVPAITELTNITGDNLELVKLWETTFTASLILVAPPDLPQNKFDYLRGLSEKWTRDQSFLQDLSKATGNEITYFETGIR